MKPVAVIALLLTFTVAFAATAGAEPLHGAVYFVQGSSPPIALMFSVSDETFVTAILTFGAGGNGRWFLAVGTTDGVSGTGQILSPSGFGIPVVPNSSFQFQVSPVDGAAGTFATTGLSGFLTPTSGGIVRIFP